MPPASTHSRRTSSIETASIMEGLERPEFASNLELSAGSDRCRSTMLAEYEARTGKSRQKRPLSRVPLWYFLYEVLHVEKCQSWISWEDREGFVFTIKKPKDVANLWGQIKKKEKMTYAKLARGIRYYYGKGVIEKACGKRFSYRFVVSKKTRAVLVGRASAESSPKADRLAAKQNKRQDQSPPSGAATIEMPAMDTSDASELPAVDRLCAASRERSSSTDSNDVGSSCLSSSESTSGDEDSISELDLFDYDRLLREVLMGNDYEQIQVAGTMRNEINFPSSLFGDLDTSQGMANDMLDGDVALAPWSVPTPVQEGKPLLDDFKPIHVGSTLIEAYRIPPQQVESYFVPTVFGTCAYQLNPACSSQEPAIPATAGNTVIEAAVCTPEFMTGIYDRRLSRSLPSLAEDHRPPSAAARKASLEFNDTMASGFLHMTRSELEQAYDPLLFENIFTDPTL